MRQDYLQSIFLLSNSLKFGYEISKIKVGYAVAVSFASFFFFFTEAVVSELCLQVSKPKSKYRLTCVSVQH